MRYARYAREGERKYHERIFVKKDTSAEAPEA